MASNETVAVRDQHRFDEARLDAWMQGHVPDYKGPLVVEQFRGGQSNPTYKLKTPNRSYVLRRRPPGKLLKSAHAVDREARVMSAVAKAGYPVAHVYGLCTDDDVIGTWFYVMDYVRGRIFWDATFPDVPRADRAAYFDAMNATISQLHSIDPNAIGLGDYGKAGNFFSRQVKRWTDQYLTNTAAGRDPFMDKLIAWFPAHIPEGDESAIVHGDYRCDNMIFHATEPRVIAVLDWELSTLGHPLADFSNHAIMYRMPPKIVAGLEGADLKTLGIPSEQEYVAAYCKRTGRDCIPAYEFYIAFAFFRLAAIFHGIKGRAIEGTASSAEAMERAACFPILAKIAWDSVLAMGSTP